MKKSTIEKAAAEAHEVDFGVKVHPSIGGGVTFQLPMSGGRIPLTQEQATALRDQLSAALAQAEPEPVPRPMGGLVPVYGCRPSRPLDPLTAAQEPTRGHRCGTCYHWRRVPGDDLGLCRRVVALENSGRFAAESCSEWQGWQDAAIEGAREEVRRAEEAARRKP